VVSALTVSAWLGARRVDVAARPAPAPGLVIHAGLADDPGSWVVAHAASGAMILRLPDPEAALHAALCLGGLADWTLPGTALRGLPGLQAAVLRMARELDCYWLTFFAGATISDAQLASTEVTS
jgi:hypothetical protein